MRPIVLALAVAAVPAVMNAQSGRMLVVGDDGNPIPFASVSVNGTPYKIADGSGVLVLSNIGNITFSAEVRRIGYKPWQGKLSLTDTATGWTVRLDRVEQKLATVKVTTAAAPSSARLMNFYEHALERQKGVGGGIFMGPEEIERRNPNKVTQLLEGLPGMRMRRSGRISIPVAEGAVPCANRQMQIVIDGMHITGEPGKPVDVDELVGGSEIMAIEVYTRGGMIPGDVPVMSSERACGDRRDHRRAAASALTRED